MFDCPKEPFANIRWRLRCRDRAHADKGFRNAFLQACFDDPIFFFNAALWVYEPRAKIKTKPFVTWKHQDPVILQMDRTIDEAMANQLPISMTVPKSRAQGGTYIYLGVMLRRALKESGFSAGLVTRNEELVDSRTDADAVMFKLAWMMDRLPKWMLPGGYQRNSTEHTIALPNGSVFSGYAATGDVARGGRKTVFAFDEPGSEEFVQGNKDYKVMSSVAHVSNCTFLVSTYGLDSGVFYESAMDPDNRRVAKLDWKDNPEHSRLAYTLKHGEATALRPEEAAEVKAYVDSHRRELKSIERRGHKMDGKVRSPWYDAHCVSYGTLVVTDRGPIPIENVTLGDRVWDGRMWVSHDGCVYKGQQETIRSYRVGLTPDHRVFTTKGWKHASDGFDRAEIRLPDGYRERYIEAPRCCVLAGSMRLRGGTDSEGEFSDQRKFDKLWMQEPQPAPQDAGLQFVGCNDSALHESEASEVSSIRRAGNHGLRSVDDLRELYSGHGAEADRSHARSHRQRWELRAGELPLGDSQATAEQPPKHHVRRDIEWSGSGSGSCSRSGHDDQGSLEPHQERLDGGRSFASTQNPEPVYDLLNCGPRRAFTVLDDDGRPLLVHNCLLPGGTPRFIARELDMDPRGAVGKLFDTALLDTVKVRDCQRPVWQGKPLFDPETLKLTGLLSQADGPLKLWFRPGVDNSPPLGPFSVGCDIAMGSDGAYSSNSVASIIDERNGEQVGEYTIMGMQSIVFARNVVGLCRWLRNARLGWEDSGVSGPFAKEVMEKLFYGNVYFREVSEIGSRRKTRKAGWHNGKDEDRADLFEKMALAMESGRLIVRSEDLIRECGEYEWEKGKIIHRPTKNLDQSEKAHGDRAIGAGVAWLVYSEYASTDRIDTSEETGKTPEYGSFLWREQQERPKLNEDSPDFGIRDVLMI